MIRFLETSSEPRVVTQYGCVYEKAPLVGELYEPAIEHEYVVLYKNLTHPHHTIMWWLEKSTGKIGPIGIPAVYESVATGSGSGAAAAGAGLGSGAATAFF